MERAKANKDEALGRTNCCGAELCCHYDYCYHRRFLHQIYAWLMTITASRRSHNGRTEGRKTHRSIIDDYSRNRPLVPQLSRANAQIIVAHWTWRRGMSWIDWPSHSNFVLLPLLCVSIKCGWCCFVARPLTHQHRRLLNYCTNDRKLSLSSRARSPSLFHSLECKLFSFNLIKSNGPPKLVTAHTTT